jgi:glycerol uptake facilitator-like aquaporin
VIPYIIAQLVGAIVAALLLYAIAKGASGFDLGKGFARCCRDIRNRLHRSGDCNSNGALLSWRIGVSICDMPLPSIASRA